MSETVSSTFLVAVPDEVPVTVKTCAPARTAAGVPFFILAHGANNNLDFPLLEYLATHLAQAGAAAVARFNFPYVERGVTSPDPRPVLERTFMQVYAHVIAELAPNGTRVFIGGKSLGGRTAVELVSRHAEGTGPAVDGVVVLGYPLHPMGREDHLWVEPLRHVDVPSLFVEGTRDPLCNPDLLRPILDALKYPGTLYAVEGGDHSLHLRRTARRNPEDSYPAVAAQVEAFIRQIGG